MLQELHWLVRVAIVLIMVVAEVLALSVVLRSSRSGPLLPLVAAVSGVITIAVVVWLLFLRTASVA